MHKTGLYDPQYEHDACGVGFVGRLDGTIQVEIVSQALTLLTNMTHRGGAGADADSGDGAGIMVRIPDTFLREVFNFNLPLAGAYGLGMIFLPLEPSIARKSRELVVKQTVLAGFKVLGWRETSQNSEALGRVAYKTRPAVWQFVVVPADGHDDWVGEVLERQLYILRKILTREAARIGLKPADFYLVSLSSRIVIYKGLMMASQLSKFYLDLMDPYFASPWAIVHQRYSTNTFPSWPLAQPFRTLAHNGEINTIRGNRNWLTARESGLTSPLFKDDLRKLFPLIEPEVSDSANLDNILEFLIRGGRSLSQAMAMLVPQAWGNKNPMGPNLRGFFEFHAGIMEPWDGPATIVFTDGCYVGASLDRNGLRPVRYSLTDDGLLVLASESGALELPSERVVEKGALTPGQMILAEIGEGRLVKDAEIKSRLAHRRPYHRWVRENQLNIPGFFSAYPARALGLQDLNFRQNLFGYTRDDINFILAPMAAKGVEPTGSMGADFPLAIVDERPQSLFSYFRQQFAQVTNPPIDSIREELVMSLMTFIGYHPNILAEEPDQARLLKLRHPILSNDDLHRLKELKYVDFHSVLLSATFEPPRYGAIPGRNLNDALTHLTDKASLAAREGARIIILSDWEAGATLIPIPSLLAVAAVNQKLMEIGKRVNVGLICQTGEAREVGHLAMLLGLGASAVNPWLAFESVAHLAQRGELAPPLDESKAIDNYVQVLCKGLLKIMSKMGISTLRSYRDAHLFEAVGLGEELINSFFPGIASRVGGISLKQLEADAVTKWKRAHSLADRAPSALEQILPVGGSYRYHRGGARHLWTAESITILQEAVRRGDYELYKKYAGLINVQTEKAFTLRGLMEFKNSSSSESVEVEPVENIMRRFVTGAMSFGSISREAHETIALAMNRIGARSNCGEGGEDPARYLPYPNAQSVRSKIKQIASGRFGVTTEYLNQADEIQIKIAQGAKPGEGGQLPGSKINDEIARVRHSTAGVTLISPPPHHDIYSIEDLAQLIYDLTQTNDLARISVKLASEVGIGTIAAGVAKAMAGTILISGFDGGTGAAPLSSIVGAGSPWEIGLAETQQTLSLNNLRGRVRLQVDGQLKTGRDVAVAALLGADEFGFATCPLVAMGCLMMRKCHTNGCPVGVATQDPKMRARFRGRPEHIINFFRFVAEEVREIMTILGFKTMDEMIGRVDCLAPKNKATIFKERGLDFSAILAEPAGTERRYLGVKYDVHPSATPIDESLLPAIEKTLQKQKLFRYEGPIRNTDRAVGAKISSRIVRAYGHAGLADDTLTMVLIGVAGQSFGAFAAHGLTLKLFGEANDYVGKGLSGGRLIIRPPKNSHPKFDPSLNIIAGNVVLYGAIEGELYLSGRAGARFAVRNSGAVAVVEGVGDHGCEYMTGGRVIVLGFTGINFAAGMSGGLAYIYDEAGDFDSCCNLDTVDLDLPDEADECEIKNLIERHAKFTDSRKAKDILANWDVEKSKFVKVFPIEYRQVLRRMTPADAKNLRKKSEAV
ncbi:MAG: glutamate synthase subunit alpha [Candidatus Adiutrix intracellularis]|nr:MAG: glutamate synthase subunit alpha [Candidatus Adiutrix intracellularis]